MQHCLIFHSPPRERERSVTRDSGHFSPDSEPAALSDGRTGIKFPLTRPHRLRESNIFMRVHDLYTKTGLEPRKHTPAERSHESFIHGRITGIARAFYFFLVLMFRRRRRRWFRPYLFIFIIILCVVWCRPPRKRREHDDSSSLRLERDIRRSRRW